MKKMLFLQHFQEFLFSFASSNLQETAASKIDQTSVK